jgi:hypothetical protein
MRMRPLSFVTLVACSTTSFSSRVGMICAIKTRRRKKSWRFFMACSSGVRLSKPCGSSCNMSIVVLIPKQGLNLTPPLPSGPPVFCSPSRNWALVVMGNWAISSNSSFSICSGSWSLASTSLNMEKWLMISFGKASTAPVKCVRAGRKPGALLEASGVCSSPLAASLPAKVRA